jgi:hypothetical protein
MRCLPFAVVLVVLALPVAACSPSGGTPAKPATAQPPTRTSPTPTAPVYTIDVLKAALVKGSELGSTVWKDRPGVEERMGPAPCAGDSWLPVPTEALVGRVDLIDQHNGAGGVFVGNTISQIGLVFGDSAAAASYLGKTQSANFVCPTTTTVPQRERDGHTASGYDMTIGVRPLTIAAWEGFMLTADQVFTSRGFGDIRIIVLGRGNAVVILSLGAVTGGPTATKPTGWDPVLHSYFDRIFYRVDGSPVPAPPR